jgi:hypothetical protein
MMYYPADADPEDVLWDMCVKLRQLLHDMEGFTEYCFLANDPALVAKCNEGFYQQADLAKNLLDEVKTYLMRRQELS